MRCIFFESVVWTTLTRRVAVSNHLSSYVGRRAVAYAFGELTLSRKDGRAVDVGGATDAGIPRRECALDNGRVGYPLSLSVRRSYPDRTSSTPAKPPIPAFTTGSSGRDE